MTDAVADKVSGEVELNEDQVAGIDMALEAVKARTEQFEAAKAQAERILAGPAETLRAARERYVELCKAVLRVNGEELPEDGDYRVGVVPRDGRPAAVRWEVSGGESD